MKSHRPFIITLALLSLVVIGLESVAMHYGRMSPLDQVVIGLFSPVYRLFSPVEEWGARMANSGALREENQALRDQNFLLIKQDSKLQGLEAENIQLRGLLHMTDTQPGKLIPAEVVAREPSQWFQKITINRGQFDGVRLNDAVIGVEGVVGRVSELGIHFSRVKLLLDSELAVPAQVLPDGSQGIVYGLGSQGCLMKYLPHDAEIKLGDRVVTSGYGHFFRQGIPVGVVAKSEVNEKTLFKEVLVKPFVRFSRLHAVMVLQL